MDLEWVVKGKRGVRRKSEGPTFSGSPSWRFVIAAVGKRLKTAGRSGRGPLSLGWEAGCDTVALGSPLVGARVFRPRHRAITGSVGPGTVGWARRFIVPTRNDVIYLEHESIILDQALYRAHPTAGRRSGGRQCLRTWKLLKPRFGVDNHIPPWVIPRAADFSLVPELRGLSPKHVLTLTLPLPSRERSLLFDLPQVLRSSPLFKIQRSGTGPHLDRTQRGETDLNVP